MSSSANRDANEDASFNSLLVFCLEDKGLPKYRRARDVVNLHMRAHAKPGGSTTTILVSPPGSALAPAACFLNSRFPNSGRNNLFTDSRGSRRRGKSSTARRGCELCSGMAPHPQEGDVHSSEMDACFIKFVKHGEAYVLPGGTEVDLRFLRCAEEDDFAAVEDFATAEGGFPA